VTYNITGPQELHGTQGQSGPTGLTPSLIFDGNVPSTYCPKCLEKIQLLMGEISMSNCTCKRSLIWRFFNWIFFKSIPEMIILTKEELTSKKRQRKIDKLCQKEQ
jgi:hypothetical protein